jgi:hypothetical protein
MSKRNPIGYWTFERCKEEVSKHNNIKDLRKNGRGCYYAILNNKWSKELLNYKRTPNGYWTYERCKEEVSKYFNLKDLKENGGGCYGVILDNKWSKDLLKYKDMRKNDNINLTFDECIKIVEDYSNKTELNRKNNNIYKYIKKMDWDLDEYFNSKTTPSLSYNECKLEALKYSSKVKFKNESSKYYNRIITCKWYELMNHIENKYKVRTYEECKEEVLKYEYKKDFSKTPYYSPIIKNKWYELMGHLKGINKKRFWTYERCKEEALKYTDRIDFNKNSKGCRYVIYTNKWFELLEHIPIKGHKYKRLIYAYEFSNNYVYVGLTSDVERRNKSHISSERSPVYNHIIKYDITPIFLIKSEYIHVDDAVKLEESILNGYIENNWNILNRAKTGSLGCSTLTWTYEKCKEEIKKYNTFTEFRKNCGGGANSIYKNKWFDLYSKDLKKQR